MSEDSYALIQCMSPEECHIAFASLEQLEL